MACCAAIVFGEFSTPSAACVFGGAQGWTCMLMVIAPNLAVAAFTHRTRAFTFTALMNVR